MMQTQEQAQEVLHQAGGQIRMVSQQQQTQETNEIAIQTDELPEEVIQQLE